MQQVNLDTLYYVDELKKLGIPQEQAEGHAKLLKEILNENLATKGDIAILKSSTTESIAILRSETRESISVLRSDMNVEFANVEVKLNALKTEMHKGFANIDSKFARIDSRFAGMEEKFAAIDGKFANMDSKFASIDSKFAALNNKFADFKLSMIRWVFGIVLSIAGTQTGLMFLMLKFLH